MREIHNRNRQHGQIDREKLQLLAESRRSLPPEGNVPLKHQLERGIGSGDIWACLQALRERQTDKQGRIFTICVNLHSEKVSRERALSAHREAVSRLAKCLFNRFFSPTKIFLSPAGSVFSLAGNGKRPLSVFTPGRTTDGVLHTHGILFVPDSVGKGVSARYLKARLLEFRRGTRTLHETAVHIAPILRVDDLRAQADYMRKNLESVPSPDRTIMFAPDGGDVAEDWRGINRRVDELVEELGKGEQVQRHRRAVRKNHLVETAWDSHRKSSAVRTGRAGRRQRAPGLVPLPKRPTEPVRLPPTVGKTGIVRWDGAPDSGGDFPKGRKTKT